MFWQYNPSSPQIDTVLFKEDLTLNELLDQENVLQELKSQNKKLVEFITRGDVMAHLVSLVTEEPSCELDERERYRRPNIACEVLTTDIPVLNERLSEKSLLTKLYAFLESEPPLNPLLASFFSRTLSMLICRKADQNWYSYQFTCLQFLDFFKSRDNSLKLLLKHLGTSAIMDLTLKLITQVEGTEMQQNILSWLENEGLVENLVALFHPSIDSDRHYNASQLLCDTIRRLRETVVTCNDRQEGSPILEAIQSPETIEKLLSYILGEELSESSVIGGISVLLTLLEQSTSDNGQRYHNSQDGSGNSDIMETPQASLCSTILAIVPHLPRLHDLLLNPPKREPVKLACGTVDPPLGNMRLSIIKLIAALIATNTPEVNAALDRLNTVQVLLDLFFQYTWNNFLHTQVDRCLAFALNVPVRDDPESNILISNIFLKCRLLERILDAWESNETEQSDGGKRRGYMGHLTNIANTIVKTSKGSLEKFLEENVDESTLTSWKDYVETVLTPINQIHQKCLGGSHPAHDTPEDVEGDFKDIPFSENTSLQQNILFQNFPENQQKNEYMQNYPIIWDFDYVSKCWPGRGESKDELKARQEYFEEMCSSSLEHQIRPEIFDGGQNGKEEWEECVWVDMPNSVWETSDDVASNSSDEEKVPPGVPEENFVDADLWSSVGVGTPVVDPGNPWQKEEDAPVAQELENNEGWANFDSNFVSEDNLEEHLKAVQLSSETWQSPPEENVPVNSSERVGESSSKSQPEVASVPNDSGEKSDNNANLNSLTQEDTIPNDDELIDNFRFLSKQGMIAEPSKPQLEIKEDTLPETSVSECGTIANEAVEQKKEVPGDPV